MLDCVKSVVLACVCFWLSGCQFHMVSSREARPSAWRPLSSGGQRVCVCVCVCMCVCVCVVGGCVVFLAQQATGLRVCRAACRPLVCCLGPHRSSLRQQCCELGLPPFVKQTPSHHCGCAPWAPSRRCDESRTFQNLGWKERGKEHLWNSSSGPASLHLFFCNPHPDYWIGQKVPLDFSVPSYKKNSNELFGQLNTL